MKIFELLLNEENENAKGVFAMSIVNDPSMESHYVALSSEKVLFKVQDEKKHILTGVALIPDKIVTLLLNTVEEVNPPLSVIFTLQLHFSP